MDTQNTYDYTVVRQFALMALVWGIVGITIGVWIASELAFPALNFGIPELTFGRLRPLHTNIVIFAFAGSVLFATSYYVVQHTCRTRLFSPTLAAFTFWGWQLAMLLAVVTLPLGMTSGKEYAELEWPIDILIAVVWCAYAIVFFGTLMKRKISSIYVANWFYGAYILAVAILYFFNNAELPLRFWPMKSYSLYPGAVDAMVEWWYGHNLVGSFLTAAFLGTMYYFLPRQIERPLYSYRWAVVHFWAIISLVMWSGPHHLLYTALPDWTQSLGMVFSVLLLIPFWGGLINGLMTLSGSWNKLRTDPILRFLVAALFFYGIASLEGPLMSIKTINAFTHYTDWTVAHAHSGGLGWIGFIAMGTLYILVPQIFNRQRMYSTRLISAHFWLAFLGVMLYLVAIGNAGLTQDIMWRAENDDGTLTYRFIESVEAIHYFYLIRIGGGILYLMGMLLMAYNVWRTIHVKKAPFRSFHAAQATPLASYHASHSGGDSHHPAGISHSSYSPAAHESHPSSAPPAADDLHHHGHADSADHTTDSSHSAHSGASHHANENGHSHSTHSDHH